MGRKKIRVHVCSKCKGSGRDLVGMCPRCKGKGKTKVLKTFNFRGRMQ